VLTNWVLGKFLVFGLSFAAYFQHISVPVYVSEPLFISLYIFLVWLAAKYILKRSLVTRRSLAWSLVWISGIMLLFWALGFILRAVDGKTDLSGLLSSVLLIVIVAGSTYVFMRKAASLTQ